MAFESVFMVILLDSFGFKRNYDARVETAKSKANQAKHSGGWLSEW